MLRYTAQARESTLIAEGLCQARNFSILCKVNMAPTFKLAPAVEIQNVVNQ